jgi:hypothetical protein
MSVIIAVIDSFDDTQLWRIKCHLIKNGGSLDFGYSMLDEGFK